jgi:hypothetical protein
VIPRPTMEFVSPTAIRRRLLSRPKSGKGVGGPGITAPGFVFTKVHSDVPITFEEFLEALAVFCLFTTVDMYKCT